MKQLTEQRDIPIRESNEKNIERHMSFEQMCAKVVAAAQRGVEVEPIPPKTLW